MRYSEVSKRYAKALHDLAVENKTQDKVLEDMRAIQRVILDAPEIQEFFNSPAFQQHQREALVKQAFADKGLSEEVVNLMLVLAKKDRLPLVVEVIEAYQDQSDIAHGVTRGVVESAIALGPDERKQIEETVRKVTKKEVILTYKTNPKIIGGLVAQVGGYTFDDSIQSHLRRMNEDLKRRVN